MEYSEVFLLAWATLTTTLAVYFRHKMSEYKMVIIVQQLGFKMIGEGRAKVIIENDTVLVREV